MQYGNYHGYPYVRFKSPDSDVFYILILLDTGVDNKKRLLNISRQA